MWLEELSKFQVTAESEKVNLEKCIHHNASLLLFAIADFFKTRCSAVDGGILVSSLRSSHSSVGPTTRRAVLVIQGLWLLGSVVIMVSKWPLSHTVLFQDKGSLLFIPSYLGPDLLIHSLFLSTWSLCLCTGFFLSWKWRKPFLCLTVMAIFTLTTGNSFLWPFELLYLELPPRFSLFRHHPPFCWSVGFCIHYFLIHPKVSPLILSVAKCLLQ